ncbi:WG repeat-containing protein [Burkholderia cenocepacia]|uniref:WG repeat-containing protein n=1 Tax=Burkholderia cenocepacia TaxID=95486 RepID=A0A3Q9FBT1_9BURK|nr:WG repeat-containing protein [Burkholderia cenocepacia]AZQ53694.1 WG repeat-containing protein [Burkholderia cenocepacia]
MAHRLYLSNVDDVGRNGTTHLGMVEWNYDFPTVLSPLLSSAPFLARNRCNDTGEADGLYADAAGGKASMTRLYAFLERHAGGLIDDLESFLDAKRRILAFLDNRAVHRYFHLDAWDVFNLSDDTHVRQAQSLLERIARDNTRIRAAIDADDPALLDTCEGLAFEAVSTFRELINQPDYDYGWEPLTSSIYDDALVFEQDGRWGVMAVTGEVLAPACYDEFGDFDAWTGVAIVRRGDRYGHVDTTGRQITPVTYDAVWAFWHGEFARVKRDGRFGVVDRNGIEVVPCCFDELVVLVRFGERCWAAREGTAWGVVDPCGQWLLPPEFDEIDDGRGVIYATRIGAVVPDIHTRRLVRLGSLPPEHVRVQEASRADGDKVFRYLVTQAGADGVQRCALVDEHGNALLAPGAVDELGVLSTGVLLCFRRGERWGIADLDGIERCAARYESISQIGARDEWLGIGFRDGHAWSIADDGGEAPLPAAVARELAGYDDPSWFDAAQLDALTRTAAAGVSDADH